LPYEKERSQWYAQFKSEFFFFILKYEYFAAGDIFLRPAGESSPDDSAGREGPFSDITVNEHLAFKVCFNICLFVF